MKKINFPLFIGMILLISLIFIALFPKKFTSKDPNYQQLHRSYTVMENGKEKPKVDFPPWKPNESNIMGVDELGTDIYARIIYGANVTLRTVLLIVLLRLLLAIPFGIMAGIGSKIVSSLIHFFNTIFTALPTLFVAFFILNVNYVTNLEVDESIIVFAVVLSVLGWGKLAKQIEEKVSQIMKEEFIEGEIAIGKSKIQIATQNMIPHLIPSLISTLFIEVGLVIFLLAQLSVFGVFVGPRINFVKFEGAMGLSVAINPEWGSMLSRIVINNRVGNYWIGLYPALAFTVGILAFNLTGEGLRIEFEKRTSRVASNIRKFGFVFSPKVYFHQTLRFKEYYKPVIAKTLAILLIITYFNIPAPKSLYEFNPDKAISHIEELIKPKYEGRITGFEGNYMAGEYIIEKLKEYGLKPYDGENYTQNFPIFDLEKVGSLTNVIVDEAYIDIVSKEGQSSSYKLGEDFVFITIKQDDIFNEEILDDDGYIRLTGSTEELINVEKMESYNSIMQRVYRDSFSPRAKISFLYLEEDINWTVPTYSNVAYNIIPKGELAKKINSNDYEVEFKIKPARVPSHDGTNILAVLPGKETAEPNNRYNKKEIIIIGSSYDGMIGGVNSPMITSKPAINLEIARVLCEIEEELDKTIVFAFWDASWQSESGARYYNLKDRIFTQQDNSIYYFDIGTVNNKNNINIGIHSPDAFQVETYEMKKDIDKWLKKKKVDHKFRHSMSSTYRDIGLNMSLNIGVDSGNYMNLGTERDNMENISKIQLKNMGQFFIDLITMNKHFK